MRTFLKGIWEDIEASRACYYFTKKFIQIHSRFLSQFNRQQGNLSALCSWLTEKRKEIVRSVAQQRLTFREKHVISVFLQFHDREFNSIVETFQSQLLQDLCLARKNHAVINSYAEGHRQLGSYRS